MDNQNNRNKQNLPGNNNPNNKNNRQRWNIILFTVMLISFIVFALYQFREDTDAREITYDQFLNMVDSGEVKKVVIEDDKIVITAKTEAEMKNSKKKGASESDVVEGSDLCLVSQFCLFDALVLGNQLLDRLLALTVQVCSVM